MRLRVPVSPHPHRILLILALVTALVWPGVATAAVRARTAKSAWLQLAGNGRAARHRADEHREPAEEARFCAERPP
jgi:hypothetical protein